MDIAERAKTLINKHYGTQKKFAEAAGISPSRLNNYLTGTATFPLELMTFLADNNHVNLNWLVTGKGPMFNKVPARVRKSDLVQVPVVSEIAASMDLATFEFEPDNELSVYKDHLREPGPYIAFKVVGQSMDPYIAPGDYAVVTTAWHQMEIQNRILAFRTEAGLTLKRFYMCAGNAAALLLPLNPSFDIRVFREDDPDYIVIGLLLMAIRYF